MAGQLGDLVISLSADIARFRDDMGKASKIAQDQSISMTKAFDGVQGAIGGIGKAFAVVTTALAGGAMFKEALSTTKEVAGEIVKLKNSMGISAEEASVLRVALDDVFLTADDMAGAASRVTKQLVNNEAAFRALGVATRDQNGNYRSTIDIISETNSKLLEFSEGTDRNVEGIKIYGRGWDEARKTLKLTADAMNEGKKRAEELHLVFGESGLKAVKDYKLAMKDIDDVAESLKVNLGMELLPELTRLAVIFGETAVDNIPSFISGIHSVEAEITRLAMLVDKAGGSITTMMHYLSGGGFTDAGQWWKEQNEMYKTRYAESEKILQKLANLEVGLDENGNPIKPKGEKKEKKVDKKSDGGIKPESDWVAAHNKYIEYEKAFEARRLAEVKNGNDFELEMNRQFYSWGLIDLDSFLNKKNELTLNSLNAEVDMRTKDLIAAQSAIKELKPVVGPKGESNESKDAENYHAAIVKEEQAQADLAKAVANVKIEKERLKNSDREAVHESVQGYQSQQAAFASFHGDLVKAAEIRKKIDEESHARKQLEIQATAGDIEAEKTLTALRLMDIEKIRQASVDKTNVTKNLKFDITAIGINTPSVFGDIDALAGLKLQFDKEMNILNEQLEKKKALNQQETEDYHLMLEQKKALTEQYAATRVAMETDSWMAIGGIVSGQLGQMTGMMNQANKDQFMAYKAMMIAKATIATAMAVVGIMAAESKLGMFAIPLAFTAGAIGAAQIAMIAAQPMPAREMGGPVTGGTSYLVGEKGPEIFTPGATGQITSNDKLTRLGGGGDISVTPVFQISGDVNDTVRTEIMRFAPDLVQASVQAVQRAINSGGSLSMAVGRM